MSESENNCGGCGRKLMQSISNRCMYCGEALPEKHHLSQEEKAELLQQKFEKFRETEENADQIVNAMRRDFGLPENRKSRKQRKADNAAAVNAALASINTHTEGKK